MIVSIAENEVFEFKPHPNIRYWAAAHRANITAEKYGCEGRLTMADIHTVLDGADCYWCGKVWNPKNQRGLGPNRDTFGIDHVIALSLGGPNTVENLVASCHFCNVSKFQADRPRRWAQKYECCIDCGTTDRRHGGLGRCLPCYDHNNYLIQKGIVNG